MILKLNYWILAFWVVFTLGIYQGSIGTTSSDRYYIQIVSQKYKQMPFRF